MVETKLRCPKCNVEGPIKVIDSRHNEKFNAVRRRRECLCGHRWTTLEVDFWLFVHRTEQVAALRKIADMIIEECEGSTKG